MDLYDVARNGGEEHWLGKIEAPVQLVGSLVFIALLHGVLTLAFIAMAGKVFVQKSQTSA